MCEKQDKIKLGVMNQVVLKAMKRKVSTVKLC